MFTVETDGKWAAPQINPWGIASRDAHRLEWYRLDYIWAADSLIPQQQEIPNVSEVPKLEKKKKKKNRKQNLFSILRLQQDYFFLN